MSAFDPEKLKRMLQSLQPWKRAAFMAACCDRMLPNYQCFSLETGHGDLAPLNEGLSEIWRWVETDQLSDDIARLVQKCDEQAPDTGEFSSIYTSAALDAANSIAATLEALGDTTEDQALEVASLSVDTVDLFVQQQRDLDPSDPQFERAIAEDPLMRAELQRQEQSLEYLNNCGNERPIVTLDMRAKFSGRSLPQRQ